MDQNNNDSNVEYLANEKPQKNKIKLVSISILGIIVISFLGVYIYSNFLLTSEKIFEKAFENGYQSISNIISEVENNELEYDINKDSFINESEITFTGDNELYKDLENYPISLITGINLPDEEAYLKLGIEENKDVLIDLELLFEDNALFAQSKELFDNIILISDDADIDFDIENTKVDYEKIDEAVKLAFDYFYKNLDKDDFEKEDDEIKIDGDKTKVTKHFIEFKDDDLKKYFEKIYEDIIEDEEYIKLLADIYNATEDEIIEIIKNNVEPILDNMKDYELTFEIYTSGLFNTLKGFGFNDNEMEIQYLIVDDEKSELHIDKYVVEIEQNKNGFEIDTEIEDIKFNLKLENITKDKTMETNIIINLEMFGENFKFELTSKSEVNQKLPNFETEDYDTLENLSTSEIENIYSNISDLLHGTPFEQIAISIDSYLSSGSTPPSSKVDTDLNVDEDLSEFTDYANYLLLGAEDAKEDNINETCFTVNFLLENDYPYGNIPDSYKGIVYIDEDGFYNIELEDTLNGYKVKSYIYVFDEEVEENTNTIINKTCP